MPGEKTAGVAQLGKDDLIERRGEKPALAALLHCAGLADARPQRLLLRTEAAAVERRLAHRADAAAVIDQKFLAGQPIQLAAEDKAVTQRMQAAAHRYPAEQLLPQQGLRAVGTVNKDQQLGNAAAAG